MWFNSGMKSYIAIRGGGDLASGVAIRLFRAGYKVLIAEISKPLSVRRTVSFSEAIYDGFTSIENIVARKIGSIEELESFDDHEIPIVVDPDMKFLENPNLIVPALIDGRMGKKPIPQSLYKGFPFVIGIGPGFNAGVDCNVVIESNRGHTLGRIYRHGYSKEDTKVPAGDPKRVLRSPSNGVIHTFNKIGKVVFKNDVIARVNDIEILAPFSGLIRGLIHDGLEVETGMKIGDLDHNIDEQICYLVSDKALAIGGSVLEILLSDLSLLPEKRGQLTNK